MCHFFQARQLLEQEFSNLLKSGTERSDGGGIGKTSWYEAPSAKEAEARLVWMNPKSFINLKNYLLITKSIASATCCALSSPFSGEKLLWRFLLIFSLFFDQSTCFLPFFCTLRRCVWHTVRKRKRLILRILKVKCWERKS